MFSMFSKRMSPHRFETNGTSGDKTFIYFFSLEVSLSLHSAHHSSLLSPQKEVLKTKILVVGNGLVLDPGGCSASH